MRVRVMALLVAGWSAAGCGGLFPGDEGSALGAGGGKADQPSVPLIDSDYRLPWTCGQRYWVTQGNHGDMCDRQDGDHILTQDFAWDFALPRHAPVLASRAGVVTLAKNVVGPGQACYEGCGGEFGTKDFANCCNTCLLQSNRVNVQHEDGTVATYWHLDEAVVAVGQRVEVGEMIGWSGTSGCSTGPHLHFQVMGACATGWCQSQRILFAEGGVPDCGDRVQSLNCD